MKPGRLPFAAVIVAGQLLVSAVAVAAEFHVAIAGNDAAAGTGDAPFRTIQRAANVAQPGDVITVHAGIYRERVNPPRGGTSDQARIVYRVAPGEKAEIRGSEPISGWVRERGDTWTVTIPNSRFGTFNPYADLIRGDWFDPRGRAHHTGAVYLDGHWLTEAAKQEDVLGPAGASLLWFARVEGEATTLWAQFPGADPNANGGRVEINVRRTVFYPDQPGRDYITVRGFGLRHAATPWAPPTAEQVGLIGTHWSRGWVIEDNDVSHSTCSGIALGKHGDAFDNTSADTAEGYVLTIERAYARGWTRERIGHHVVRSNHVAHCEQAGIVGSLGAAFSTVVGNHIHDIHVRRLFSGAEMAGIKFHAAIDTRIAGNHIHHTVRGLWLDWMAQGTRVTGNLFHDNAAEDLFVEVDHGPFMVDNNFLLSGTSLLDMSEGGAYAHNLFAGRLVSRPELSRSTPFHPPHSTATAGLVNIRGGDDRFLNNVFLGTGASSVTSGNDAGHGLWVYDRREFPLHTDGNVYANGARPHAREEGAVVIPAETRLRREPVEGGMKLDLEFGAEWLATPTRPVTTERLGLARIPGLPYLDPDGGLLRIDRDFRGLPRNPERPTPGPLAVGAPGTVSLVVRAGRCTP